VDAIRRSTVEIAPTTVTFPRPLEVLRDPKAPETWMAVVDGTALALSNLDKRYWRPEGFTKADLVTYYANIAPWALPYVRDRALTLKRMPGGADEEFFYAKQVPEHAPDWVRTAAIRSVDSGKTIDYVLGQDARTLVWLANLGCIELHPWHSRTDDLSHPDYAFFDLDPMGVDFAVVREVALLVRDACTHLGLRSYPRTSGATGMQVYVPLERVHTADVVTEWVGRVCAAINRADPERTTMVWTVADRPNAVFLDHRMNTEAKNIAGTYSLRPERGATVATPLRWDEVEADVRPSDFTIETIWGRLAEVGDLFEPVLQGGQDLRGAMAAVGMAPTSEGVRKHVVDPSTSRRARPVAATEVALADYRRKRDFTKTPEPPADVVVADAPGATAAEEDGAAGDRPRFVLQHHLATRLHHDLRLEHDGTAVSWAVPKGLPDVPGVRHLAVQTEDHPLSYMTFEGEIPAGEYGGGPVRIWDTGTYEAIEWRDGKVTFRLDGRRHRGEYHLFRTDADWLVVRADEPAPGELPGDLPQLDPMLAGAAQGPFDDPAWTFEVKWDGVRAIATTWRPGRGPDAGVRLMSRQGNDISQGYPELTDLWERVVARNAVLDGELVAFDEQGRPSFQRLQQRMHVRGAAELERARRVNPVTYVVFDLLAVDGEVITHLPLTERLARLDEVVVPGAVLRVSDRFPGEGSALFAAASEQGLEGIMAKRNSSAYRPGKRSRDWLKIKIRRRVQAVVGGWLPGDGGRRGELGALLVGWYDDGRLVPAGRVGTGFDEAERRRLLARLDALASEVSPFRPVPRLRDARWIRPELVIEVEYAEITAGGKLRAPAYKGLVEVDPARCTIDAIP
jgi:bifunctional non-homologous end joining protein LigD